MHFRANGTALAHEQDTGTRMDCFAHATIGGYQIATTLNCYSPWRF